MLEWQSFDFAAGTIRIQPTKWYKLKTDESSAVLPVEPEIPQGVFLTNGIGARKPLMLCLRGCGLKAFKAKNRCMHFENCSVQSLRNCMESTLPVHHCAMPIFQPPHNLIPIAPSS
jgi:hypothetical protein